MLVARQVSVVESVVTAGDHGHVYALVVSHPVEQLLESLRTFLDYYLVVVSVVLWQHRHWSAHDWVKLLGLILLDIIRLTEKE